MYTVGHWIEITAGTYRGWRGVVTEIDIAALHAPCVRLHLDPGREPVASPVELDLRNHTDAKLVCIAPGENPFDPPVPVAAGTSSAQQAQ